MKLIKGILFIGFMWMFTLSCNNEDILQDNTHNDDNENVTSTLNSALIEWGTPYDAVMAHMDGYILNTTLDGNTLHFSDKQGKQEIAYRFHDSQLCATLVVLNTNEPLDYKSLLSEFTYLGTLDDCSIYEDDEHNTMASIWNESDRIAIGYTPIKSDAYEQAEPISAITGDCLNIGISTAELSGSVTGVDETIEVGFIYGTTMDLSENNGIKVSTTSSGDFTMSISDLDDETHYYYRAYAIVDDIYYFGGIKEFITEESGFTNPIDLAVTENANCYIVSKRGTYKFPAVKGKQTDRISSITEVIVLWETFGTKTAPVPGDLISRVTFENDFIIFKTNREYKKGNAVIAALDKGGEILWSWHIWFSDKPQSQVYYNNAGTMMDRNLGATSANPGEVSSIGLYYQWGRKDPFLGPDRVQPGTALTAESTITWPSPVNANSNTGTIAYSITNPTTFILGDNSIQDWCYNGSAYVNKNRWTVSTSNKSIYDPCPAGWRVPDNDIWIKAAGSSSFYAQFDNTRRGINLSNILGDEAIIWYPASGYLNYRYGIEIIYNPGKYGACWSTGTCTGQTSYLATSLFFYDDGDISMGHATSRANGCPVRCMMD